MAGKPYRSALDSHFEQIAAWRRERKTWVEIAELLRAGHGIGMHFAAVQKFFARRLARPQRPAGFEPVIRVPTSAPPADNQTEKGVDPFFPESAVDPFTLNLPHGQDR